MSGTTEARPLSLRPDGSIEGGDEPIPEAMLAEMREAVRKPKERIALYRKVEAGLSEAVTRLDVQRDALGDLAAEVALFDVFRGAAIGDGQRSLAFAIRLQAPDRTLTDDDVQQVRQRAIAAVESTHAATLRA